MTSGSAIDIQANSVVLDLSGFQLGGESAGLGTLILSESSSRSIARSHHHQERNDFGRDSVTRDRSDGSLASQGHIVEDIRADHNTQVGIHVGGSGNIVRNNQVVATGGTINFWTQRGRLWDLRYGTRYTSAQQRRDRHRSNGFRYRVRNPIPLRLRRSCGEQSDLYGGVGIDFW